MPQVEKEVLAANYDRVRGGNLHLANNARDQGWPHPALYLRAAFPDRVDVIEQVIADGDRVGLLFRVTGTHTGNFFGIPATGKRVDVYEVAMLRIVNGQMVEGWFMMDEAELLRQLGWQADCAAVAANRRCRNLHQKAGSAAGNDCADPQQTHRRAYATVDADQGRPRRQPSQSAFRISTHA
jgi:predicted ester cyclase